MSLVDHSIEIWLVYKVSELPFAELTSRASHASTASTLLTCMIDVLHMIYDTIAYALSKHS